MRTMAASGILCEVLPGQLNFERLDGLVEVDCAAFFTPDPLLRLAALVTSDAQAAQLASRWRLSNDDRDRLRKMAASTVKIVSYMSIPEVRADALSAGAAASRDLVRLRWAEDKKPSNAIQWRALLAIVDSWVRPVFPLTGRDVMNAGVPEGPLVGPRDERGRRVVDRQQLHRRSVLDRRAAESRGARAELGGAAQSSRRNQSARIAGACE